jgi:hypothetical protein
MKTSYVYQSGLLYLCLIERIVQWSRSLAMGETKMSLISYGKFRLAAATVVSAAMIVTPSAALAVAAAPVPATGQGLTWSVAPSPNVKPATNNNELNGVSCVSAADCIAVGEQAGRTATGTLVSAVIESWNGRAWSVVPSPQPGNRALYGVSCTSAARCTAVGVNFVNPPNATLVESWNGTRWSVTPDPGPGSELLGVSCVSPTACTAVGDRLNSQGYSQTLTELWNGTKWSTVPSPNMGHGTNENFLSGVSCISPTACTAVGQYGVSGSAPLIESWNGARWTIVPAPNRNNSGILNGVSCASLTSCVAVGSYFSGPDVVDKTLTESWNGARWSAGPAPKGQSQLFGASCVSATDCWAAGNSWAPAGNTRTLIEHWNGTGWTAVPTPNAGPASYFNNPVAVSCASARACAAVGDYGNFGENGLSKTLTMIGSSGS